MSSTPQPSDPRTAFNLWLAIEPPGSVAGWGCTPEWAQFMAMVGAVEVSASLHDWPVVANDGDPDHLFDQAWAESLRTVHISIAGPDYLAIVAAVCNDASHDWAAEIVSIVDNQQRVGEPPWSAWQWCRVWVCAAADRACVWVCPTLPSTPTACGICGGGVVEVIAPSVWRCDGSGMRCHPDNLHTAAQLGNAGPADGQCSSCSWSVFATNPPIT